MNTGRAVVVVCSLVLMASSSFARDWDGFRGPSGNGVTDEKSAPREWSATRNVRWKVALPKPGNGSPIVSHGRVFVTSAEDDAGRARSTYCFDRETGKQLWVHTVKFNKEMPTHKTNPYCGTTPAANGERVVVWHASAGLYCLDFEGKEVWSRDLGEFRHMWGYRTSPVLYQGKVILNSGPGDRVFLAAFDVNDGKTLWETEEPHTGTSDRRADGEYQGSWSTPVITPVNGKDQIICMMPNRVVGYDPDDGGILWSCGGLGHAKGDLAYSSPMIAEDLCVAIGGFRGPALAVRLGGTGDLTSTSRLWRNERQPQSIGSGVFLDGYVYRPNAGPGTIECLDPKTGDIVWTERAVDGSSWGSMVYAAGHCYLTNQDGTTVVFNPSPEKCEILAKNPLGEPSNSTPAISSGEVFIRTSGHLFCIAE